MSLQTDFLSLVKLGIGHDAGFQPAGVDWKALDGLAVRQGLVAVLQDAVERLVAEGVAPADLAIDESVREQWIVDVLQAYEGRYVQTVDTIGEMASFYNSHGIRMMVLKGWSCSLDWPRPDHRPCGDIDIWLFGRQKEADAALRKEMGIQVDTSHHHHTVFYWRDLMVENHYNLLNVYHHRSTRELESIMKRLASDDSISRELNGVKVYLPSADFHALFLLRHAMSHFASTDITLRQLLDWAFFVRKHGAEVDWTNLEKEVERFGMKRLYDIFNAICVEDLGFADSVFPHATVDRELKSRVLHEILKPEFDEESPKGLLRRIVFKYRRWKANGWKHELCYSDSMWSAFWSGVWSHILKPSSI